MHNSSSRKEFSSLFIFVPVMAIGLYLVYLAVSIPFQIGREHGLAEAPFRVAEPVEDDGEEVFNFRELRQPSEELISTGARIYNTQCASCHGAEGNGMGPAGMNLAVQPRAFDADFSTWKVGPATLQMYETLENGVGGNMPAFNQLNPRQKFAVIHFVHDEFMADKDIPEDSEEAIAALPEPSVGAETMTIEPYANPRIPVTMAIEKMLSDVEKEPTIERTSRVQSSTRSLGEILYLNNCASCHGVDGQGTTPREVYRSSRAQLRQLSQGPALLKVDAPWVSEYSNFRNIVVEGVPGGIKPGSPTLTSDELQALHDYTLSLREDSN